jgi:tRNA threonylcarbamoyladenosine biosynthesis protein TsaB
MEAMLGIDTATPDVAVAATAGGRCVAERSVAPVPGGRPRHTTALLSTIEEVVLEVGGWERIGAIAVGIGPGSFTGLRIGIATARALAQGSGRPLCGVESLASLALGIGDPGGATRAGEGSPPALRLAVIDARRGEAFAALYGESPAAIWGPMVESPGALAARLVGLDPPPMAAGDGALRFREELEAAGARVLPDADPAHRLSARNVCLLAATPAERVEDIRPLYLRQPDAQLWLERDRGNPDGA